MVPTVLVYKATLPPEERSIRTMAPRDGVDAALAGTSPTRTALSLFSLADRVALVTGGHRGIGLEMALALAEAGAVVYCLDLPSEPDSDWLKVQSFANELPEHQKGQKKGRLEYISGDVTDQKAMWALVESIVDREGRIDICMANAGILHGAECLDYPAEDFRKVWFHSSARKDVEITGFRSWTSTCRGYCSLPRQREGKWNGLEFQEAS